MTTKNYGSRWIALLLVSIAGFAQQLSASTTQLEKIVANAPSSAVSLELDDQRVLVVDADGLWLKEATTHKRKLAAAGRSFSTATQLPTGKVLVWGGLDNSGLIQKTGLLFDPQTDSISPLPDIALTPRAGHAMTVLTDGRVLLTGGWTHAGPATAVELWDVRTNRVETAAASTEPMFGASAELGADGRVTLSGGLDGSARSSIQKEVFDPQTAQFSQRIAAEPVATTPDLAASLPANASRDVQFDGWIALRFSEHMQAASLNARSVTLLGPNGPNPIKVTAAESGRLAFVLPARDMLPGSKYTLFISGAKAAGGEPLPLTSVEFSTRTIGGAAADDSAQVTGDNDSAADSAGLSDPPATSARLQDASKPAPITMHLHTGTAKGLADFNAHCTSTSSLHGYRFCRDGGSVEGGIFSPGAANTKARWRVNTPLPALVTAKDFPASALPAGVTSVFGTVRRIDDHPLAGATVSIGKATARTDSLGRFVLAHVPDGKQLLNVDGHSADRDGEEYGQFVAILHVEAGHANAVPFNLFVPRIAAIDKVSIPSPTLAETVVTHPAIPGFEIHIPVGAVLRDRNGSVVTQLAIVPMPTDRSTVPTPGNFPVYYSTQPEGVTIDGLSVASDVGLRVVYPNYTDETKPGELFWYYDPDHDGWTVYSTGHISADQKQLVADSRVGAPRVMPNGAVIDGKSGPPEHNACTPKSKGGGPSDKVADPVACSSGIFDHTVADLSLNDVGPVAFTRTYLSKDPVTRSFGRGASDSYGIFLSVPGASCSSFASIGNEIDLITGDGFSYPFYSPIGSSPLKAIFTHRGTPSRFYGATIKLLNGAQSYLLQLVDGTQFSFNSHRCPTSPDSIVDSAGNATMMFYNAGLTDQVTLASGRFFKYAYNTHNLVQSITDNSGRAVNYAYDASDRLQTVTYPDLTTENYTYDNNGNMKTVVDRSGNTVVTNDYYADQRVQKQTYPDGKTYQFAYTIGGNGKITSTDATDENNHVERFTFDAAGYPLSITHAYGTPLAQTTSYVRGQDELVTSMTDALGRVTTRTFDSIGQMLTETSLAGTSAAVTTTYTYTPDFHKIATVTDPLNHTTTYGYTFGCLTSIADPLGHASTITCNSAGQPLTITDALNHTATLTYVGYDLRTVTDPLSRTTTFSTDSLGRVISVVDPLGRETRSVYDTNGWVRQTTDALNQNTAYGYDNNGNLKTVTDPNGGITQFGYDARNRKISRTDALNISESWTYDGKRNVQTYTDRKGQLTQYQYDELDRPKLVTYFDNNTVTSTYDSGNRLTSLVDTVSGTISRAYDGLDRMTQEQTPQGTVNYTYDTAGHRATMTPASQAQIAYSYDNAGRLSSILQGTQGGAYFGYDNANRRTTVTLANGLISTYGYDNASQLTSILYQTDVGATLANVTYGYDLAGQRISRTGGFGSELLPTPTYASNTFDLNNKQTLWNGYSLGYDLNGDPTSNAFNASTYTFDVRHRLTQIQQGATTVASFTYDALNRRTSKAIGGATTSFLYDGINPVQETQGASVSAILTGLGVDERFWRDESAGRRYFATDALGSTVALTDVNLNVVQTYSYEPYGEDTASGSSDNPYQYTGRENDGTGLYYYRTRYYNPRLKRFISEDTAGLSAGLNEYAYVDENPIEENDPTGREGVGPWTVPPGPDRDKLMCGSRCANKELLCKAAGAAIVAVNGVGCEWLCIETRGLALGTRSTMKCARRCGDIGADGWDAMKQMCTDSANECLIQRPCESCGN